MPLANFIVVGENIHCTRIVKSGGRKTVTLPDGTEAVAFKYQGEERTLPVPPDWSNVSPAYNDGKIKHVALAMHHIFNAADDSTKQAGIDYLCYTAERQINAGATFLDVNVDEYSNIPEKQAEAMEFLAGFLSSRYDTPLSIDSSNPATLEAGLKQCRTGGQPPMINSISLERPELADLASEYDADVIVNASGRDGMPCQVDDRLANFREIIGALTARGIAHSKLHLDPLVFPISTDPMNGQYVLQTNRKAAQEFEGVHLNGGLSNISFGMPNRKLLNMVFVFLCAESGTDGGIIDPVVTPVKAIAEMDVHTESFKLASAVLTGEDMFGMEYITAHREGRLG